MSGAQKKATPFRYANALKKIARFITNGNGTDTWSYGAGGASFAPTGFAASPNLSGDRSHTPAAAATCQAG